MNKNLTGAFSNQNPFYYIENELLITTPYTTNDAPIKINDYQNSFIKNLLKIKDNKIMFLSPRQKGLSTIMMSYAYWLCSQVPKTYIGVYTYRLDSAKMLQTKVTPKDSSVVTLNSGSAIHFTNQSRISFINNSNFLCGTSLDYLFIDNSPNFDKDNLASLLPCLTQKPGKIVALVSGDEGKFSIPIGLSTLEFTAILQ